MPFSSALDANAMRQIIYDTTAMMAEDVTERL